MAGTPAVAPNMGYECTILADSISQQGHRLTTFCATFPRFILAEVNTHRMLSRNSASSRAIPIEKSIAAIEHDMFVPTAFGANQRGMQAERTLDDYNSEYAALTWKSAGHAAIDHADSLAKFGVHKAWGNRVIEPYKWHTAIITATEWSNFFALRTHKDAQPEFREIALMMQEAYHANTPVLTYDGSWHLPLVGWDERRDSDQSDVLAYWDRWKKVSIGRCARVSVEQHDGTRDLSADIGLHDRLLPSHHLSPFEHVARPFNPAEWSLVAKLRQAIAEWSVDEIINGAGPELLTNPLGHAAYLQRRIEFQGVLRGWHAARLDVPFEEDYGAALCHT